ncbi:MAG: DedA family protein [Candidatus Parcubacteria bacterium]|nr:DedA family protein [Candidatus Parcubacteria bacterium]
MITEIIKILADVIIKIIGLLGYPGVFILMLLESCGFLIPSEIIMSFAGFLAASGRFNFLLVALIGVLGNLIGSLLAYWISARAGRRVVEKFGRYILLSKNDLDMTERWFSKRGRITVLLGRLLPVVRTYISFPAGLSKMKIGQFIFYTFIGALPWCILFAWLGQKLGNNWILIHERLHNFNLLITGLVVVLMVIYLWRHLKRQK